MQRDSPSVTAIAVAIARALAGPDAPAPDPVAVELLPRRTASVLRRAAAVDRLHRWLAPGFVDHVALRTAAIDAALVEAVRDGAEQLVVLGAGLDARAFRLPELASVDVFEVDHPVTQRYKQRRVKRLVPTARSHRFVSVDFERDALVDELAEAGHDASRATCWIWEGVTMYLPEPATRGTLRVLRERSAAGSRLVVTYARPLSWLGRAERWVHRGFDRLGEPLLGLMRASRFGAVLADEGWQRDSDTGYRDWRRRHDFGVPLGGSVAERLAVASCAP